LETIFNIYSHLRIDQGAIAKKLHYLTRPIVFIRCLISKMQVPKYKYQITTRAYIFFYGLWLNSQSLVTQHTICVKADKRSYYFSSWFLPFSKINFSFICKPKEIP
jgi:hypothetical protein